MQKHNSSNKNYKAWNVIVKEGKFKERYGEQVVATKYLLPDQSGHHDYSITKFDVETFAGFVNRFHKAFED